MDLNILVKTCNLFVPSQCDCKIELVVVISIENSHLSSSHPGVAAAGIWGHNKLI